MVLPVDYLLSRFYSTGNQLNIQRDGQLQVQSINYYKLMAAVRQRETIVDS